MDEQKSNGMFVIGFIVLCAFIVLSCLASCKTREIVREVTVKENDTLIVHNTDTVIDIRFVTQHDSTHHEIEKIVTLNETGDTIKLIVNNYDYHNTHKNDSSFSYKSRMDSLDQRIRQLENKNVVKEKIVIPWKGVILTIIVIFALGIAMIVLAKWKMNDK